MTSTAHPTHDELMQLALLEAYGLLDEYEEAEFGRMFRDASATDQDDIRELQAEVTADLAMLPDFEPPADLKARVLARVVSAVDSEESTLAPLAKIGRAPSSQFVDVRDHVRNLRAATFWRAAVFVLCAALIVSLYFQTNSLRDSARLAELALGDVTTDQLDELGPSVMDFLTDNSAEHLALIDPEEGEARARGFVLFREEKRDAFVHISGLNPNAIYVLKVRNADGSMQTVREFEGVIAQGMRVKLDQFAVGQDPDWRVYDADGERLVVESHRI